MSSFRRNIMLANATVASNGGGSASLEFPIYLKTKEGSGDDRTRDADELSLKIVNYFFENCIDIGYDAMQLDLSDDEVIYVDEFRITTLTQDAHLGDFINLWWDNMGSFWWAVMEPDGLINIEYMD